MKRTRDQLSKLLDMVKGAAQENIPAGALINQLPAATIPPASGTGRGGVTLSDDAPEPIGTADPGTASTVSRSDHVHAVGTIGSYVVALDGTIVLDADGEPVTSGG